MTYLTPLVTLSLCRLHHLNLGSSLGRDRLGLPHQVPHITVAVITILGYSVEFMMKLSGHMKYDTFKKYVRLSAEEYADDIAKSAEHCLF